MASALASLTANYTDSEGEEDLSREEQEEQGDRLHPTLAERLGKLGDSPASSGSGGRQTNSQSGTPTKKAKLVSYIDPDAGLSDDDRQSEPMDLESDDENKENGLLESLGNGDGEHDEIDEKERSHCMEEMWDGGVRLPPEPRGECSRELQEKFTELHRKKLEYGYDFKQIIQKKKAFRNPSIYEKLILHCGIDEFGTNFPAELYDGHLFGKESYYEELARAQKEEMDRREKAAEARRKAGDHRPREPAVVTNRKSKWDQGSLPVKAIPAFGALKRK